MHIHRLAVATVVALLLLVSACTRAGECGLAFELPGGALPSGTVGQSYNAELTLVGIGQSVSIKDTDEFEWTLRSGSVLPGGLSIARTTRTSRHDGGLVNRIVGTPTTAGTFTFSIDVRATIRDCSNINNPPGSILEGADFTITIRDPLTVVTASLANAVQGQAYGQTLQATGGTTPYTWSLAAGALPAGLALNGSTGAISGTPTSSGTASFTVRAQDAGSPALTATRDLSIVVDSTALTVTTTSLPDAILSVAYNQALQAAGGSPPYSWSIAAGVLPTGLSIDASSGVISGTPTGGRTDFTVQASDSSVPPNTASRALSISVVTPNPAPVLTGMTPDRSEAGDPAFTLIVVGTGFVAGAEVLWNGVARPTTVLGPTQVTADIPANDVASASFVAVTVQVRNPAPTSGPSNGLPFFIDNPLPVVLQLLPALVPEDFPPFTLRVSGTDFIPASVVQWNGGDRPTTFVNSGLLDAQISAADIANTGNVAVTVFNPPPRGGTSNVQIFRVDARVGGGVELRISVSTAAAQGDDASGRPDISADGRLVSFRSEATNLVAGDTNLVVDSFRREPCAILPTPPPSCATSTQRVSVDSNGNQSLTPAGGQGSVFAAVSSEGRLVAFSSRLDTLVPQPADQNGDDDIFVRDTCRLADAGCMPSTTRVSVTNAGAEGEGDSRYPEMTPDGRFVVFQTTANLADPLDQNLRADIYVRDTCQGALTCTPGTVLISANALGPLPGASTRPNISSDGRFVTFLSLGGGRQVFLVDRDTDNNGVYDEPANRVIVQLAILPAPREAMDERPAISGDGRFVAFATQDTLAAVVPQDVLVFDTCRVSGLAGLVPNCPGGSRRIAAARGIAPGEGDSDAKFSTALSGTGRFLAFASAQADLVPADTNNRTDVFLTDTCFDAPLAPPCTPQVLVASFSSPQSPPAYGDDDSQHPTLNADGRIVAFDSKAGNLVPGDTNNEDDVFLSPFALNLGAAPVPTVTALAPASVAAGSPGFNVAVTGTNFTPESVAQWNGVERPTIFVSTTKLLMRVFDTDLAAAGSAQVAVLNPLPGGVSGPLGFTTTP